MLSGQNEFGFAVIKARRRFPGGLIVAIGAGAGDLAPMLIEVATDTIAAQPLKGGVEVPLVNGQFVPDNDKFGLMAGAAFDTAVLSHQRISGQRMIEPFLAMFPPDQVIGAPLMFDMAFLALAVFGMTM